MEHALLRSCAQARTTYSPFLSSFRLLLLTFSLSVGGSGFCLRFFSVGLGIRHAIQHLNRRALDQFIAFFRTQPLRTSDFHAFLQQSH
jgi:hypothetical protein